MAQRLRNNNYKNDRYRSPGSYNQSSSAYDYAQEIYDEPKPNTRRRKRVKKNKRDKYVMAQDPGVTLSIWMYGAIGVVFICAIVSVLSMSTVFNQKRNVNSLISQLKESQSRTADLTVEVTQSMDLVQVEHIARTKLEMSEPQVHQITKISIPQQSYSVSVSGSEATYTQAENNSISFDSIKKFFIKD